MIRWCIAAWGHRLHQSAHWDILPSHCLWFFSPVWYPALSLNRPSLSSVALESLSRPSPSTILRVTVHVGIPSLWFGVSPPCLSQFLYAWVKYLFYFESIALPPLISSSHFFSLSFVCMWSVLFVFTCFVRDPTSGSFVFLLYPVKRHFCRVACQFCLFTALHVKPHQVFSPRSCVFCPQRLTEAGWCRVEEGERRGCRVKWHRQTWPRGMMQIKTDKRKAGRQTQQLVGTETAEQQTGGCIFGITWSYVIMLQTSFCSRFHQGYVVHINVYLFQNLRVCVNKTSSWTLGWSQPPFVDLSLRNVFKRPIFPR